jgi:hypothetical protein
MSSSLDAASELRAGMEELKRSSHSMREAMAKFEAREAVIIEASCSLAGRFGPLAWTRYRSGEGNDWEEVAEEIKETLEQALVKVLSEDRRLEHVELKNLGRLQKNVSYVCQLTDYLRKQVPQPLSQHRAEEPAAAKTHHSGPPVSPLSPADLAQLASALKLSMLPDLTKTLVKLLKSGGAMVTASAATEEASPPVAGKSILPDDHDCAFWAMSSMTAQKADPTARLSLNPKALNGAKSGLISQALKRYHDSPAEWTALSPSSASTTNASIHNWVECMLDPPSSHNWGGEREFVLYGAVDKDISFQIISLNAGNETSLYNTSLEGSARPWVCFPLYDGHHYNLGHLVGGEFGKTPRHLFKAGP